MLEMISDSEIYEKIEEIKCIEVIIAEPTVNRIGEENIVDIPIKSSIIA
jgi:hypothetical protein